MVDKTRSSGNRSGKDGRKSGEPLPSLAPPGMGRKSFKPGRPAKIPTARPAVPKRSVKAADPPAEPPEEKAAQRKPEPKQGKARRRRWPVGLMLIGAIVLAAGSAVGVGVGYINLYLTQLPVNEFLEEYQPAMPSRIFAGDDNELMVANFYSDTQNREMAPLSEMPKNLINAVVALEDRRFYQHSGISLPDLVRAVIYDIRTWSREQGASTITIQLAEDLINNDKVPWPQMPKTGLKSFERKFWEWKVALQIEKRYTKDEILEIYFNQVFLGYQVYGVARAAEFYFGKELSELTLKECALFAGMLQAPNRHDPIRNPENAQRRTSIVLRAMLREGYITQEQYDRALNEPFELKQRAVRRNQIALHPYYSWEIERRFSNGMFEGSGGEPLRIKGKGIDVISSMDVSLQQAAEAALRKGIEEHERRFRYQHGHLWGTPGYRGANRHTNGKLEAGGQTYDAKLLSEYDPETKSVRVSLPNVSGGDGPFDVPVDLAKVKWDEFDVLKPDHYLPVRAYESEDGLKLRLAPEKHVQGALVAVQPSTGRVVAMAGGYDYNDKGNSGNYIRATQSTLVQPGSAFKPLLMAAALSDSEDGWSLASILHDIEYEYWSGWSPQNYYGRFFGDVTMRYTLVHSLNAASVWLLDNYQGRRDAGIQHLISFCDSMFDLKVTPPNLSIALGSAGMSPMELAQAYAVLANRGDFVQLHLVDRVYQRQDSRQRQPDVLYEFNQPLPERKRLSPEVAYLATYLMRGVVEEGTADEALALPFWSVGKTGTTDECTYAWYAGYSNDLLCIVYMGHDDPQRSLGVKMTGSQVALPVWMDFMSQAYEARPEWFGEIEPPQTLEFHEVCDMSGELAVDECFNFKDDHNHSVVHSLPFIPGTAPKTRCRLHGKDERGLRPYHRDAYQIILGSSL